jgi:hypothetical protein
MIGCFIKFSNSFNLLEIIMNRKVAIFLVKWWFNHVSRLNINRVTIKSMTPEIAAN